LSAFNYCKDASQIHQWGITHQSINSNFEPSKNFRKGRTGKKSNKKQ